MTGRFYVYVYFIDGVPAYVGKGVNGRDASHLKIAKRVNAHRPYGVTTPNDYWYNALAKALRTGAKIRIERVLYFDDEDGASWGEIELIAVHGRRKITPNGILYNRLKGGDGFSSEDGTYACTVRWSDPRHHVKMKRLTTQRWADPKSRASIKRKMKMVARKVWADPKHRVKMKMVASKHWADPNVRAKHIAALRKLHADPNYRAKMKRLMRKRTADPVFCAKQSAWMRERRTDPVFSAKNAAAIRKPEVCAKKAASLRKLWSDPVYHKRRTATLRKVNADPVKRATQSASMRKRWAVWRAAGNKVWQRRVPLHVPELKAIADAWERDVLSKLPSWRAMCRDLKHRVPTAGVATPTGKTNYGKESGRKKAASS